LKIKSGAFAVAAKQCRGYLDNTREVLEGKPFEIL
jgi:hypothetical protein